MNASFGLVSLSWLKKLNMCLGTNISIYDCNNQNNKLLQLSQVKRTPQDYINEFIIRKLNPLVVVDFRFMSAFLHA